MNSKCMVAELVLVYMLVNIADSMSSKHSDPKFMKRKECYELKMHGCWTIVGVHVESMSSKHSVPKFMQQNKCSKK